MSKSMTETIGIVAAVVTLLLIVGVVFGIVRTNVNKVQDVGSQMSGMLDDALETKYTTYEGRSNITGSEVLGAIGDCAKDDIRIQVTNLSGTTYYYIQGSNYSYDDSDIVTLSTAKKKGAAGYVNPNGTFEGSIIRSDADNSITDLVFVQLR